jgi:NADP-dependent 3-hydroxy acid dehydrogenase YdfG
MALADYRIAIVTGAGRGIGAETVRMLARRGLETHATSRSPEKLTALAEETGCRVHGVDIADRAAVMAAFSGLEVDVLVNNAAAAGTTAPLHATDEATFDTLLAANIKGPLNLLAAVVPGMIARGRGHVVNIGSVAGRWVIPGMPAYAVTKAGLHHLCANLRLDLHGSGVRVSEIVPGRVRTGIHLDMMADPEEARKRFYDGYSCLEPEDVASAIAFVLDAPQRMDVTLMEILPTDQSLGGGQYFKRGEA